MHVQIPEDLRNQLETAVRNGRFRSVDDAMTAAARLLVRQLATSEPQSLGLEFAPNPDPFLGSMRDCAALMDEVVADAYRQRDAEVWRDLDLE